MRTPPIGGASAVESQRRFRGWLARVGRRWWGRRVAEAVAVALLTTIVIVGTGIGYMSWSLFDAAVVATARSVVYVAVPLLAAIILLPRLLRRLSPPATARYIEAGDRALDALVISAVQISEQARSERRAPPDGSLEHALLAQAAATCERSPTVRTLERRRLRRAAIAIVSALLLAGGLVLWGSAPIQHGLALLFTPAADPAPGNPYRLEVAPGDITVAAGDDQAISASPQGFRPERIELLIREPGGETWTSTPMTASASSNSFETLLFDLQGAREYYVRSGPVESGRHRIEVVPRPTVERIDLRYAYPARTGRAPELIRDSGPIRAVRGTQVEIRAVPDRPLPHGELVLDGERRLPMKVIAGELHAVLDLQRSGSYRIELPVGATGRTAASAEYAIEVHEDDRPEVALTAPGRDARVTPIEEIGIGVRASDDVAVHDLEIVLNINGVEERIVRFATDPAVPTEVAGTHVLALEELGLQPGDLISYHARARDAGDDPERLVTTDLYFMDVRPFELNFRRAQGGGGGGAGGQGQGEDELTAQQRSLVVALFKVQRDRAGLDAAVYEERLTTLREAQARIRDRVDAIVRRLAARRFLSGNEGYRRMSEELPNAARAMVEVESLLAVRELDGSLASARQALLHLQRADAAFRDVQVAMSQAQGGQGSGSQTELANLFRLEMDRFRNPYESLQRGRWDEPDRALDEALAKLRELARRQQREIERTQQRAQRGLSGENSQQALAREVEELMRELERLTRQRDEARAEQARRSLKRLRAARDAMEQAGRHGDPEAGREALDRLNEVRRDIERTRPGNLANGIGEMVRQAESALGEQRDIRRRLQAELEDGIVDRGNLDELSKRKQVLAGNLRGLTAGVERLRQQAAGEEPATAEDLEAAHRTLHERRLEERMRNSARALIQDPRAQAATGEPALERDLEAVRQRLARAGERSEDARAGEDKGMALERLRAMVRNLKADQRRLADTANRGLAPDEDGTNRGETGQAGGGTGDGTAQGGRYGGGPVGSGYGYDGGYDVDFSGMRRQIRERMAEVSALEDAFGGLDDIAEDVEAVITALNALGAEAGAEALQALRLRQAELLARLQEAEAGLRDGREAERQSLTVRPPVTVAPRYQSQVERYYRNLSEEPVAR